MKTLIIFNHQPYDDKDVTWNGLRLADQLVEADQEVRISLMNDSVDMARDICLPPPGYDQNLSEMLKGPIAKGVPVKVCGTYMARCGIHKNQPYFDGPKNRRCPRSPSGSSSVTRSLPSNALEIRKNDFVEHGVAK